jgi:hypothetical protein
LWEFFFCFGSCNVWTTVIIHTSWWEGRSAINLPSHLSLTENFPRVARSEKFPKDDQTKMKRKENQTPRKPILNFSITPRMRPPVYICQHCGDDIEGPNRFFCNECHSEVSTELTNEEEAVYE